MRDITWRIDKYEEENPKKIIELRKKCFPEEDLEKQECRYWTWEFRDNYAGKAQIYTANDKEEVVGHYAICPSSINVNGVNRCGSIVVDVMTDPNYRFQGMFTSLGKYSLDNAGRSGVDFSYGFPIRKTVMPGHIKVGWKIAFSLPVYVYPVNFYKLFKHFTKMKVLSAALSLIPQFFYNIVGFSHKGCLLNAVWDKEVGNSAEVLDFLRKIQGQHCVIQERSQEFIAWRFDTKPYAKYDVLKIYNERKEISGYAVLKRTEIFGLDCLVIIDMQALNCNAQIIDYMLFQIRQRSLKYKVSLVGCMSNNNPYKKRMLRKMYVRSPYVFKFILHENRDIEYADILYEDSNWFLMWADTDDL